MKKIIIALCTVMLFSGCKNASEESTVTAIETEVVPQTDEVPVLEHNEEAVVEDAPAKESSATDKLSDEKNVKEAQNASYASFGKKITANNAISKDEMLKKYKSLKKGDTINVKFASTIKEVCKKKGCWMSIALPNEKESFVKFKDYAFFVPLNADKSDAIISGKAFVDVVPVAELQHYAKDGGKSAEEIAKITEPKITYAFQADGVLIKE